MAIVGVLLALLTFCFLSNIFRDRLSALPSSSPPSFGNTVYNVRFEKPLQKGKEPPVFGHRYSFFLKDAVEDVPEYVVHWEHFEK
jgi:mRNA (guanine-N7-)-methyltransferase